MLEKIVIPTITFFKNSKILNKKIEQKELNLRRIVSVDEYDKKESSFYGFFLT